MALAARLRECSSAIGQRWLEQILATYPDRAAAVFLREQDPFANPVGHALRAATRAAMEAFLAENEPQEICTCLEEVIRIRAVQEFTPAQAISFVFLWKEAIRVELGEQECRQAAAELLEVERRIDQVALGVFDIYVRYRAQVYQLRVNEMKRSVARLVETVNRGSSCAEPDDQQSQPAALERAATERGGNP
jgi:hypothetical protein